MLIKMKIPTRNKKQKDNNIFNNEITNKIKHMINDAIIELKNINVVDILLLFLANYAIGLSDWISLSILAIIFPLLSIFSFIHIRARAYLDKFEHSALINT